MAPNNLEDSEQKYSSEPLTGGSVINPSSSSTDPAPAEEYSEQSTQESIELPVNNSEYQTPPQTNSPTQTVVPASSFEEQLYAQEPKKRFRLSKKVLAVFVVLLLIGGGSAAAYFGYVVPNKPENVWQTALVNTGKGYDKLANYATTKKDVKGWSADGSFKVSGSIAADGTFKGQSDSKNGQVTGSTSAAGLKVNYDLRAIESPGNTPDVYFKIDGIQGLGDLVSGFTNESTDTNLDSSQITKALNGLNGQWYFVDHTLFDQFAQGSNDFQFSSKDLDQTLKAVGDASKQYLFTDNSQKAALVVKNYVGKETQDGRSVYHYKVGVNKNNLKSYSKALCENLAKTKLFKLFGSASGVGDTDLIKECQDSSGIENISANDTSDVWVDLQTKLIHKIRFTDKKIKGNYTDLIQNYTGGDEFPFAVRFHSQSSVDSNSICEDSTNGACASSESSNSKPDTYDGEIKMKLNMKTNTFAVDASFETTGYQNDKGTFKLNIAPTSETFKVEKPAGAKTIIELLNDLGLDNISTSGAPETAKDSKRKSDINVLRANIEAFYSDKGYYPTLANLNDANWRKVNMKSLDASALKDPEGTQAKLAATPQVKAYSYQPAPVNCSADNCSSYTLTATLSTGSKYQKDSLN
jgi:hypothetical protein